MCECAPPYVENSMPAMAWPPPRCCRCRCCWWNLYPRPCSGRIYDIPPNREVWTSVPSVWEPDRGSADGSSGSITITGNQGEPYYDYNPIETEGSVIWV